MVILKGRQTLIPLGGGMCRVFTELGEVTHTSLAVELGDESGNQCWKDADNMASRAGGRIHTFGAGYRELVDGSSVHTFTVEVTK